MALSIPITLLRMYVCGAQWCLSVVVSCRQEWPQSLSMECVWTCVSRPPSNTARLMGPKVSIACVWTCVSKATLYNTARLMGLKVSIACVWTCVSRPPSIMQPLLVYPRGYHYDNTTVGLKLREALKRSWPEICRMIESSLAIHTIMNGCGSKYRDNLHT